MRPLEYMSVPTDSDADPRRSTPSKRWVWCPDLPLVDSTSRGRRRGGGGGGRNSQITVWLGSLFVILLVLGLTLSHRIGRSSSETKDGHETDPKGFAHYLDGATPATAPTSEDEKPDNEIPSEEYESNEEEEEEESNEEHHPPERSKEEKKRHKQHDSKSNDDEDGKEAHHSSSGKEKKHRNHHQGSKNPEGSGGGEDEENNNNNNEDDEYEAEMERHDPRSHDEKVQCSQKYDCRSDRWGNNIPLNWGQAVCNRNYMIIFTDEGIFQWMDCDTGETHVYFDASDHPHSYFVLMRDASWNIFVDDDNDRPPNFFAENDGDDEEEHGHRTQLWKEVCLREIHLTPNCLDEPPKYDCPYLHMRNSGVIVLNWIDDEKGWMERKVYRVYKNLNQWLEGI